MNRIREERIKSMTHHLYRAMPGAPPVPRDQDGATLWGEVDGNNHYDFCNRIARLIDGVDVRTHVNPD